FNDSGRDLALAAGARWVDVTEISRSMLTDPSLVAVDGLHPTGALYRRWAEHLLPTVLTVLGA
ncbi:MAG: SGNH/GDSL hydrolase family protein, partial [Gemmatimonadaceae bacterium]